MGAIYRAVCRVNGKAYVGQTTKLGWRERYSHFMAEVVHDAKRNKTLRPFAKAVLKHGLESFDFRDLMTNVPDDSLDALEKFFICYLNSSTRGHGYNAELGGNVGKQPTEETILRIRRARRGPSIDWFHLTHGEVSASVFELVRKHPEQNLRASCLGKVKSGLQLHHKGWRSPTALAIQGHRPKRKVVVWSHSAGTTFIGTKKQLIETFPQHRIGLHKIAAVERGAKHVKSHKGWSRLRFANETESFENRMSSAPVRISSAA